MLARMSPPRSTGAGSLAPHVVLGDPLTYERALERRLDLIRRVAVAIAEIVAPDGKVADRQHLPERLVPVEPGVPEAALFELRANAISPQ